MSHTSFTDLLKKYLSGNATPAEQEVIEKWYALIEEAPRELSPAEYAALEQKLWAVLEDQTAVVPDKSAARSAFKRYRSVFRYAAAIALLISGAFVVYLFRYPTHDGLSGERAAQAIHRICNSNAENEIVILEDGSRVSLTQGSELTYADFSGRNQREVSLKGEAFFEITENREKPFLVNTDRIITRVLGTSFRVKATENTKEVEVSVKTGSVSVYEKSRDNDRSEKSSDVVILTPNQQVVFKQDDGLFVTGLVPNPEILPETGFPGPDRFNYNDTALSKVLSDLKKAYHIELELKKSTLGDCPLTANLGGKDLYIKLDLICAAIQGSYQVQGTTIWINGKGCD